MPLAKQPFPLQDPVEADDVVDRATFLVDLVA